MIAAGDEVSPRVPGVTYAAIGVELEREAAERARLRADRLARGTISHDEADRDQDLAAAWLADLNAHLRNGDQRGAAHGLGWTARREGLRRELEARERTWPERIARGTLGEADAARRIAALRALLALYDDGLGWPDDPLGRERAYWTALRDRGAIDPAAADFPDWARQRMIAAGLLAEAEPELALQ